MNFIVLYHPHAQQYNRDLQSCQAIFKHCCRALKVEGKDAEFLSVQERHVHHHIVVADIKNIMYVVERKFLCPFERLWWMLATWQDIPWLCKLEVSGFGRECLVIRDLEVLHIVQEALRNYQEIPEGFELVVVPPKGFTP